MSGLFEDPPIDLRQMKEAVEREIRMREQVYPRWIQSGRLTKAKADHEIRCMSAVLDVLRTLASDEPHPAVLEAMARAHDKEEAAQKGEPSPWTIPGCCVEENEEFASDRRAAMREAWKVIRAHL